jgi:hypothetical protein
MTSESKRMGRVAAVRRALSAMVAVAAFAAPLAEAQVAQPAPVITSPQEVAGCLCLERNVSTLANEVLARNRIYEEKRLALEQLESEVAAQRARMNVNDVAQVDAFRALLDRRNAVQAEFATQVTPEYASVVDNYNRQVSDFNARCGTRSYDTTVLASVRANLVCPAK